MGADPLQDEPSAGAGCRGNAGDLSLLNSCSAVAKPAASLIENFIKSDIGTSGFRRPAYFRSKSPLTILNWTAQSKYLLGPSELPATLEFLTGLPRTKRNFPPEFSRWGVGGQDWKRNTIRRCISRSRGVSLTRGFRSPYGPYIVPVVVLSYTGTLPEHAFFCDRDCSAAVC